MAILVFKTNIRFKKDIEKIEKVLNNRKGILHWNIDQHDIDKVLRIGAIDQAPEQLIEIIQQEGFVCEELPD